MERVEHDVGVRQILFDRRNITPRHVHRHRPHPRAATAQALPEGVERVGAFAPTDVNDGAGFEVEDQRAVAQRASEVDFVDGDGGDLLQGRLGEALAEMFLLDAFDEVPADAEEMGDGLDGSQFEEVEDEALEGAGVGFHGVGEAYAGLALGAAGSASQARQGEDGEGLSAPDGDQAEEAGDVAVAYDVGGGAGGALGVGVLYMEVDRGALVLGFEVLVAMEAEGAVKERGGQGGPFMRARASHERSYRPEAIAAPLIPPKNG